MQNICHDKKLFFKLLKLLDIFFLKLFKLFYNLKSYWLYGYGWPYGVVNSHQVYIIKSKGYDIKLIDIVK